jgi:Flp pilus assembly protein TadD
MKNRTKIQCGFLAAGLAAGGLLVLAWPAIRTVSALAAMEEGGDRRFRAGDMAGAETAWREVLAARPDRASARNKLSVVLIQCGRYEDAGNLLTEGIGRQPNVASYSYNLGLLRAMQGRYHEALPALDRVLELNPSHSEVHFLKGVMYQAMGRDEEAKMEFIRELNVDPATPEAWGEVLGRPMAISEKLLARLQRQAP